jgi:hypothetical protein
MIILFPALRRELAEGDAPPEALLLDPGSAQAPPEGAYRPAGLPLDPARARRIVEDSLRFGEQFKKPGDMFATALFQASEGEHSWSIRAELEDRLRHDSGRPVGKAAPEDDARAQGQFLLLLGAALQERELELRELGKGLDQAWSDFGQRLGLGEDGEGEDEAALSISRAFTGTASLPEGGEPLPWPWLLGAAAALLPEGTVLAASDAAQAAAWSDLDLGFAPAPAALGLPGGWLVAQAPAFRLAGLRRAPAGAHWQRTFSAAIPAS